MQDNEVFCVHCFESREQLPASLEPTRRGTCPWCGTRNQRLYPMHVIADQFRELAALYPIVQSSDDELHEPLFYRIYHDWGLFDDRFACSDRFPDFIQTLIRSGLDNDEVMDQPDVRELVKPIDTEHVYRFRDSLASYLGGKTSDGFIDYEPPPLDWFLSCVVEAILEIPENQAIYRAQVWDKNIENARFSKDRMKAPPCDKARSGRSNRDGQRTLYCSDDIGTCIAEVRPFKGAGVAVSQIMLQRSAHVIDFFAPRWITAPLQVENIEWAVQTSRIIHHIEYLFSIPANHYDPELYYRPTQALCDSLRSSGYDGIKYRSSLGAGANFAFFDPDIGLPEEPEYYWIENNSITYSDVEPFDSEYPEHPYANTYRRARP